MGIKNKIREAVRERLEQRGKTANFTDDELLMTAGHIDSLDIIHLVMFLEQEYGVDFATFEFEQEQFDSVDKIVKLVEENRGN